MSGRLLWWCLFIALSYAVSAGAAELSTYRLGTGDQVYIHVLGEPDLTMTLRLSDAGTVSFPFLGELRALNITVGELEELIGEGLKGDYLIDPRISISVVGYRQFFISGEVQRPGGYDYAPGLTLRKAIALAGGFTERASKTRVKIISEGDPDNSAIQTELDEQISPGDIITISQRVF